MQNPNLPNIYSNHGLIEWGYALYRQILILSEEFNAIEKAVKFRASAHPYDWSHRPEGEQWIGLGRGCECRILSPTPRLKTVIDPSQVEFLLVQKLCRQHLSSLFREVTVLQIKDPQVFRSQATQLLPPIKAKRLIKLCSDPSDLKITWKGCGPKPKKLK